MPKISKVELDGLVEKIEELEGRLKTIRDAFERHCHLDQCLSDPAWCHADFGYSIAGELYRAIKRAVEGGKK